MRFTFDSGIYDKEFITKNMEFVLNTGNIEEYFKTTQSMNILFELYYEYCGIMYFCPFENNPEVVIYITKYDLRDIIESRTYTSEAMVDKTVVISNTSYCDICGEEFEGDIENEYITMCDTCGTIYYGRYKVILSKTLESYFKDHSLVKTNSTIYSEGDNNGI